MTRTVLGGGAALEDGPFPHGTGAVAPVRDRRVLARSRQVSRDGVEVP